MLRKLLSLLLLSGFLFVNVNCATVMTGRNQELSIVSNPPGAIVTIGSSKQITPATFLLNRSQGIYVVKVEKEGYKSVEIILKRGTNGWAWGNIVNGMLPGILVDLMTGSTGKFNPDEIYVDFVNQKLGHIQ